MSYSAVTADTPPRYHHEGPALARHTAIYLRVSSRSQDTQSQEPDLRRWAEAQAGESPVRWYRDKFTGKTMDRPGFNRLVADVEAGKVARVVVWRLDRLGRTAKGLTALFDDLLARGVDLVSLKDGLDLETPAGDFAEVFAVWQVGPVDFRSRMAPLPQGERLRYLSREFAGTGAQAAT